MGLLVLPGLWLPQPLASGGGSASKVQQAAGSPRIAVLLGAGGRVWGHKEWWLLFVTPPCPNSLPLVSSPSTDPVPVCHTTELIYFSRGLALGGVREQHVITLSKYYCSAEI